MPELNQQQHLNIAQQKAKLSGYINPLEISTRKDKKYMIINNEGKSIHFGSSGHSDFILNRNRARRRNYRLRHGGILNKFGTPSYKIHGTPAHASYHILW